MSRSSCDTDMVSLTLSERMMEQILKKFDNLEERMNRSFDKLESLIAGPPKPGRKPLKTEIPEKSNKYWLCKLYSKQVNFRRTLMCYLITCKCVYQSGFYEH